MKFTNTLTRKLEEFEPINKGKVGIYSCGPTVYGTPHIGNFRSFIFDDILRRSLEFCGFEVRHVINITDVGHLTDDADSGEDKMIVAMRREGKTASDIAEFYTNIFLHDLELLNIKKPHVMPRATEHIDEQIQLVKDLEERGFTYQTSDGIYFDTSKLSSYGELAHQKLEDKEEGARVEKNPEKKNSTDFALWKFSPKNEKREMEWDSPWGIGFPGWHLECSAMSEKYLDSPFDIHTGGEDHITVHHPNEMAQTEAVRGNKLANYWLHNAFLMVDSGKMSKSIGNIYSIEDLEEKGFNPLSFRYFILGAHYRSKQNFTWEALKASQNTLNNLEDITRKWKDPSKIDEEVVQKFREKIEDDLNTPEALAVMWSLVNNEDLDSGVKSATILKLDEVMGLDLDRFVSKPLQISEEVQKLLNDREQAREAMDWKKSDSLRDEIKSLGFVVEDGESGQSLREAR